MPYFIKKSNFFKSSFYMLIILSIVFNIFLPAFAATTNTTVPTIYKKYIDEIKKIHSNWKFEFYYTDKNWNDIISMEDDVEDGVAINTIPGSYPLSYRSPKKTSYNASTDTYKVMDGSSWYQAASELIEFYMDPRNFLNENNIYQFEKLGYDSETQTLNGVKKMLAGTFMENKNIKNESGNSISYAQAFIDAAKASGVSPYHLVSKVIQEVGTNGSSSVSGTVSQYPGIYNFYNIGATAGSNPVLNGLKWASQEVENDTYKRPWNSQYKSIVGGAIYIGKSYINKGQNTIYLEKFDIIGKHSYLHQYMTNVMGAYSEGQRVGTAYKNMKMTDNPFTFVIPVYNNMPVEPCSKPISAGSPACWLSELKIDGATISPEFTFSAKTNNYKVSVPSTCSSVSIKATPYNSKAIVNGTQATQSNTDSGIVVVSSKLNVRTGPGTNYDSLMYSGEKVQLPYGTKVTKLDTKVSGSLTWNKISFIYGSETLTGWACSIYYGDPYIEWGTVASEVTLSSVKLSGTSTEVKITVTFNKNVREYILTILKKSSSASPNITSSTYSISDKDLLITKVKEKTKKDAFLALLKTGQGVTLTPNIKNTFVGTGDTVTASSSTEQKKYTVIIYGDINGDGEIDTIDLMMVQKNILSLYSPQKIYTTAMDVNGDCSIDAIDLMIIQKNILGLYKIN